MKLLHISDLHIGKRVNEYNMLEDQQFILSQILCTVEQEKPSAILIAGDVYDKSQPSAEAVELLDEFLTTLIAFGQPVFMISGNHDSPERLGFGSRIMKNNGLHIAGVFDGTMHIETLTDEFGPVNIYLLPFIKPALVRPYFEQNIESFTDAVQAVITEANIDINERNILVSHQFVTNGAQQPVRSDSESISVGGLDNVDTFVFDGFDYVALGHLHGPQGVGIETIRYAGSPLKYSFSESRQNKSVTILELGAKGNIEIRLIPLTPLHDMREIKGPIAELMRAGAEDAIGAQDYIHAIITDEEEIYDAIGQLRQIYPNIMNIDFENSRTFQLVASRSAAFGDVAQKSPMELFSEFYQNQNNCEMTPEQIQVMQKIFEKAGGVGA
jgi:exonuclease SbcD